MDEKYIFGQKKGNETNCWVIALALVSNVEDSFSLIMCEYSLDGALLEDSVAMGACIKTPNASAYIFDTLKDAVAFAASKHDPCPAEGSFYGYKKAKLCTRSSDGYIREEGKCIITLRIPEEAARTGCYYERKCRAKSAEVVKIERICGMDSLKEVDENYFGFSAYYSRGLRYEVGQTVSAGFFDSNKETACASGIHFFLKKEEAWCY